MKQVTIAVLIILFFPVVAFANVGVPMIFLSYPAMLMALLPIIFFETKIFKMIVPIPFKKALISNGVANGISTIAGFPLAWGFLLAIEMITTGGRCGPGFSTIPESIITVIVEAAWICPRDHQLYWFVPTAFILSLIVAFFLSLIIEYLINKRFHQDQDKKNIKKAVYLANISSYALLIALSIGFLIFSIFQEA